MTHALPTSRVNGGWRTCFRDRFTNRATYYDATRPGYPKTTYVFLENELSFTPSSKVADVGPGTGNPAEMLLKYGNPVLAVEPN